MPSGGKRPGAGRPPLRPSERTVDVTLRLRVRTALKLRRIPYGERSKFVSDCIDAQLI